jgi:hypothetical protein
MVAADEQHASEEKAAEEVHIEHIQSRCQKGKKV